jgi:hypothetical protein
MRFFPFVPNIKDFLFTSLRVHLANQVRNTLVNALLEITANRPEWRYVNTGIWRTHLSTFNFHSRLN